MGSYILSSYSFSPFSSLYTLVQPRAIIPWDTIYILILTLELPWDTIYILILTLELPWDTIYPDTYLGTTLRYNISWYFFLELPWDTIYILILFLGTILRYNIYPDTFSWNYPEIQYILILFLELPWDTIYPYTYLGTPLNTIYPDTVITRKLWNRRRQYIAFLKCIWCCLQQIASLESN